MGNGATRRLERVAAAMGDLGSAPAQFEAARDVPQGGVLLALPALLATGLLRFTEQFYALPKGFYGIDSIFLLLALMALARIASLDMRVRRRFGGLSYTKSIDIGGSCDQSGLICSGAANRGVSALSPSSVSRVGAAGSSLSDSSFAMPKSSNLTWPSSRTSTLAGLILR